MEIKQSFPIPLSRQINEWVRISRFTGNLLNSKAEWNMPPVVRINVENETKRKQQNELNSARSPELSNNTQIRRIPFQYRSQFFNPTSQSYLQHRTVNRPEEGSKGSET